MWHIKGWLLCHLKECEGCHFPHTSYEGETCPVLQCTWCITESASTSVKPECRGEGRKEREQNKVSLPLPFWSTCPFSSWLKVVPVQGTEGLTHSIQWNEIIFPNLVTFHDFLNRKPGRPSRSAAVAAALLWKGLKTNMLLEKIT